MTPSVWSIPANRVIFKSKNCARKDCRVPGQCEWMYVKWDKKNPDVLRTRSALSRHAQNGRKDPLSSVKWGYWVGPDHSKSRSPGSPFALHGFTSKRQWITFYSGYRFTSLTRVSPSIFPGCCEPDILRTVASLGMYTEPHETLPRIAGVLTCAGMSLNDH